MNSNKKISENQFNISNHVENKNCNSKFSKRHYVLIASLLKETTAKNKFELAQDLAQLFTKDNPRFSFQKFAKASGLLEVKSA